MKWDFKKMLSEKLSLIKEKVKKFQEKSKSAFGKVTSDLEDLKSYSFTMGAQKAEIEMKEEEKK